MALQSLLIPIISVWRSAGISQARNSIMGLNKSFGELASSIGKAGGAFAAFQGLSAAREFAIGAVENTQQFERNLLALSQVFEGISPRLRGFIKDVEDYGIGQNQAAQASVFIGSVLKQYGFNVDEAADATQRIVKLAQDLATTYGYDVQEALLAVTALFRGEFDPIEKFGVAMKQNEINAELAARGLDNLEGAARENAEAIITLDFLFQRAGDSVGAFTRATDTLYAAQKRLEAGIANIQIAFGAPLQEPLANLVNIFADIVRESGPGLVDLSEAVAQGLDDIAPIADALGSILFELIQLLELPITLIKDLAGIITFTLTPALEYVADVFNRLNTLVDAGVVLYKNLNQALKDVSGGGVTEFTNNLDKLLFVIDLNNNFITGLIDRAEDFDRTLANYAYTADEAAVAQRDVNNEQKRFELQMLRSAEALERMRRAAEVTERPLTTMQALLESLGITALDAEGAAIGLAAVFGEIEEAARKSEATIALEEIGFSAGQIEQILTRPDWAEIFGAITRLAKLAALDISQSMSVTAAAMYYNTKAALEQVLKEGFGGSGASRGGAATNFVGDFFAKIDEEVRKESARRRLSRMGASEGLIEAILGAGGWEKVFQRVIRDGVNGLQKLQEEFNKTRAGIEEITAATEAFEEAQQKALDAARKEAEAFIAEQQRKADAAWAAYERAREAADNFLERLEDFNNIEILPNVEEEVGRFENAVIGSISNIRRELESAFRSELIFKEDFDAISAFVAAEEFELRRLAQARDDLAKRYSLSEALIGEYKRALTGALQLTQLFSQLKTETETRTVTEVQRGVAKLGDSLKEFEITVTRSYEETIQGVQSKTTGLLQGFRDMAQRSRDFAENLRKLRELGLDPMLFDQLVRAGVIAGGETAQALVDGGSETITEINGLFTEINQLGADLGEEVAVTMYGAGIDLTNGLLEGIKSQQDELLALARSMAESFSAEFASRISIAIEKAVAAARAAADAAQAAVPNLPDVDIAGLAQLNDYLANAEKALGVVTGTEAIAGIQEKMRAVQGLKDLLLAGEELDLSGIQSGLSTGDLLDAVERAKGTTTNVYNVSYGGSGNRVTSYADGIAFAEGIAAANASNPNLQIEVFGR